MVCHRAVSGSLSRPEESQFVDFHWSSGFENGSTIDFLGAAPFSLVNRPDVPFRIFGTLRRAVDVLFAKWLSEQTLWTVCAGWFSNHCLRGWLLNYFSRSMTLIINYKKFLDTLFRVSSRPECDMIWTSQCAVLCLRGYAHLWSLKKEHVYSVIFGGKTWRLF